MTLSRRGFVAGIAGILAAGKAPAIVREPMKLWVPKQGMEVYGRHIEMFGAHDSVILDWRTLAEQHRQDIERAILSPQYIHRLTPNDPSPLFHFTSPPFIRFIK